MNKDILITKKATYQTIKPRVLLIFMISIQLLYLICLFSRCMSLNAKHLIFPFHFLSIGGLLFFLSIPDLHVTLLTLNVSVQSFCFVPFQQFSFLSSFSLPVSHHFTLFISVYYFSSKHKQESKQKKNL